MALDAKSFLRRWQERLWPIHSYELKKIVPLFFMKAFISLTYGVLTALKDAFVVTAKGGGAEVIPILKGWIVLPIAMAATIIYSKLTNVFRRSVLFYSIILIFITFVLAYGFLLYPNLDRLSPHESADWLLSVLGQENGHWVAIYRNWMQSLFFVTAELWGAIVIFLLFWGFVNHITNFQEAKRYYNLIVAGGDIGQICTGLVVCYYTRKYIGVHFLFALKYMVCYVFAFGLIIMALHWWITRHVLTDKRFFNPEQNDVPLEQKTKLSLIDSLKFIAKSKYLLCIAIMVVAYGLTMNLVEVTWKANLKLAYPDTGAYQDFMGTISSTVGVCSLFCTTLLSGVIIRILGWRFCAQVSPVIVGAGSLIFLTLYLNQSSLGPITALFGLSPLMLIVLFGAFQNISSKVSKYAFFDASKEMAFIPLDQESKVKGKAAIDVVGGRLGKSGAAWIQIVLIQIAGTGSVFSITRFLLPMIACTVFFWILSVRSLNKQLAERQTATNVPA